MPAAASGNGHDERVVADLPVLAAPGRHVGHGVGPADADAARVRRLPAVAAPAHPVIVVAQGHHAHAVFLRQLTGPVHGKARVQGPEAPMPVPTLDGPHSLHTLRDGMAVDLALVQILHHPRESVHAVAVHAVQAVLGEHGGRVLCVLP